MFIRFVVGADDEHHRQLSGIFTETRTLLDEDRLHSYQEDCLSEVYDWFATHLPCPPFWSGKFSADAVAWYRVESRGFITRMWDLVAILHDHDQPVRLLRSPDPGRIVYEDDFQILAEQWRHL